MLLQAELKKFLTEQELVILLLLVPGLLLQVVQLLEMNQKILEMIQVAVQVLLALLIPIVIQHIV